MDEKKCKLCGSDLDEMERTKKYVAYRDGWRHGVLGDSGPIHPLLKYPDQFEKGKDDGYFEFKKAMRAKIKELGLPGGDASIEEVEV